MRIAIIGCGHMGAGLAKQLAPFHQLFLHDRDWNLTQELAKKIKSKACQYACDAIKKAQFIFLAIKPQNLKEFACLHEQYLKQHQIVISLLAGTPLNVLKHYLPHPLIVRIMPNLAICYGAGVMGIVESMELSLPLIKEIEDLLKPLGMIFWLKENKIDALTSLTSSGPAFLFTLIEAMTEAGVAMGFQAKDAQYLILQMIQGCLTLLEQTNQHPAELKRQIASPNGTTIAGLRKLEKENVRSGVIETFLAAYERSQELAKNHEIKDLA